MAGMDGVVVIVDLAYGQNRISMSPWVLVDVFEQVLGTLSELIGLRTLSPIETITCDQGIERHLDVTKTVRAVRDAWDIGQKVFTGEAAFFVGVLQQQACDISHLLPMLSDGP